MKAKDGVVNILNKVLTADLTAINQYFVHAKMCENWGYERLYHKVRERSIDEMKDADEIIVATEKKNRDDGAIYFSRHSTDGKILGPPRRAIGAGFYGHHFEFLPGSDTAVDHYVQNQKLYIVTPRQFRDWFHPIDLERICKEGGSGRFVGIMDISRSPKIVWSCGDTLFAVDLKGRHLSRSDKEWSIGDRPEPFYSDEPPVEGQRLIDVSSDGEDLLLVYSRPRSIEELPEKEMVAAAERFLPLEELEHERRLHQLKLEEKPAYYDHVREDVDKERGRLKIAEPVRNIEDWKRLMPEHYNAALREREESLRRSLAMRATWPLRYGERLEHEGYRDIDEYRRWLKGLDLPARTTFILLRDGRTLGQATVSGYVTSMHDDSPVASCIAWKTRPGRITIVLALDNGESAAEHGTSPPPPPDPIIPGFYLIEWRIVNHAAGG